MGLERKAPWADLIWLPIQRFGYRQLMYYVVVKAVITAVNGPEVAWGKLERQATVALDGGPLETGRSPPHGPALGGAAVDAAVKPAV
jgi:hypothetical protein